MTWLWVKIRPPGIGPQFLVPSFYQGNPFWGCPIFDPQPGVFCRMDAVFECSLWKVMAIRFLAGVLISGKQRGHVFWVPIFDPHPAASRGCGTCLTPKDRRF